jgi:hypothetical protein
MEAARRGKLRRVADIALRTWLKSACNSGPVAICNVHDRGIYHVRRPAASTLDVDSSRDGKLPSTGCREGDVKVWDTDDFIRSSPCEFPWSRRARAVASAARDLSVRLTKQMASRTVLLP